MNVKALGKLLLAASLAFGGGVTSAFAAENELVDAVGLTKPLLDVRLRYEYVDQVPLARDANAVTVRTRAGFETGEA